jgi:hypothetical protein
MKQTKNKLRQCEINITVTQLVTLLVTQLVTQLVTLLVTPCIFTKLFS